MLGLSSNEMLRYVQQASAPGAPGDHGDDGEIQHLGDTWHTRSVSAGRWWTGCLGDCLDDVFCYSSLGLIVSVPGDWRILRALQCRGVGQWSVHRIM